MAEPIGALRAELSANVATFERDMGRAASVVSNTTRQMEAAGRQFNAVGASFQKIGTSLTVGLTAPLAAFAISSTKSFLTFDKAMTESLAIMGKISPELRREMEGTARAVALTTTSSAKEAADAYYFLGSAGLSAAESMKALPTVAEFSQAGLLDMAKATEYLMDTTKALGMNAKTDLGIVGDVITKAAVISNASIQQLSESMTTKAATAMRTFGVELTTGAAILGVYADQGIKGTIAGERFDILLRTMTQSARDHGAAFAAMGVEVFDASGNVNNLGDTVRQLEKALGPMSAEQRGAALATMGFKAESQGAILALVGMSGKIKEYETTLKSATGATHEIADAQRQSFSFQLQALGKMFTDAGITIGQALAPVIEKAIAALTPLLAKLGEGAKWFAGLSDSAKLAAVGIAAVAAAAGPAIYVLGTLASSVGSVINLFTTLSRFQISFASLTAANGVIGQLGNTVPVLTARLALMDAGAKLATMNLAGLGPAAAGAGFTLATAAGAVALVGTAAVIAGGQLLKYGDQIRGVSDPTRDAVAEVGFLSGAWILLGDALQGIGPFFADLAAAIEQQIKDSQFLKMVWEGLKIAWEVGMVPINLVIVALKNLAESASWLGEKFKELGDWLYKTNQAAGEFNAQTKDLRDASALTGRTITDWAEAQVILAAAHKKTSAAQREQHQAAVDGKKATDAGTAADKDAAAEAAKRSAKLAGLGEELKRKKAAEKAAAAETRKHAEELRKLGEALTGAGLEKKYENLVAVIGAAGGTSKITAAELGKLGKELEEMGKAGDASALGIAVAAEELRRLEEARKAIAANPASTDLWFGTGAGTPVSVGELERTLKIEQARRELAAVEDGAEETARRRVGLLEFETEMRNAAYDKAVEDHRVQEEINARLKDRGNIMGGIAAILVRMGGEWAKIGAAQQQAAQATEQFLNAETWAGVVNGIVGVVGAFNQATQSASGFQRALGGALVGAEFGGQIGAAVGGPMGAAIGSAIGGVAGAIAGALRKPEFAKVMDDVGRDYGVKISEGLAKAIAEDSKRLGDRLSATLVHLPEIFKEAGGVEEFGLDKAIAATRDLFSAIQTGKLSTKEAGAAFDEAFGMIAPSAIDKTTGLARASFLELISLSDQFGLKSAEVQKFLQGQATDTIGALRAVFKTATIDTQAEASGFGAAVAGQFAALRERGLSAAEAMKQMAPVIADLQAKLAEAGLSGGAAFDAIARQAALASDEVTGPLIAGIGAGADAIAGLHNQNLLTQESFGALAGSIGENYDKLRELGHAGPEALGLIAGDLQTVWELQQDYGYAVDESTQKLLDEAVAAGVVGDAQRTAEEQMTQAVDRLNVVLEALAKKLGVDIPDAAKKGAQGVTDAFGGITVPEIKIPYSYQQNGESPQAPDGEEIPEFAKGGIGNFGSGTLAMLHGLEAIVPLNGGSSPNPGAMGDPRTLEEIRGLRADLAALPYLLAKATTAAVQLAPG